LSLFFIRLLAFCLNEQRSMSTGPATVRFRSHTPRALLVRHLLLHALLLLTLQLPAASVLVWSARLTDYSLKTRHAACSLLLVWSTDHSIKTAMLPATCYWCGQPA
jgi:hypothetical protein